MGFLFGLRACQFFQGFGLFGGFRGRLGTTCNAREYGLKQTPVLRGEKEIQGANKGVGIGIVADSIPLWSLFCNNPTAAMVEYGGSE